VDGGEEGEDSVKKRMEEQDGRRGLVCSFVECCKLVVQL